MTDAATRATVLLVEDDLASSRSLRRVLRAFEVVHAAGALEAIEYLTSGAAPPDVILSDFVMVRGSGVALYEWLQRERPELCQRLVFLTGARRMEGVERFLDGTQTVVLEKPVDVGVLRETLTELCGK